MKKIFLSIVILLSLNVAAFAQVKEIAQDVLNAYKKRDVELLKKHSSAIFKLSISDDYFKDETIGKDLKAVDNWDGKIKDIRYQNKEMMGANVTMATVYFSDLPQTDEIYAVLLSNFNNTGWVMFANGLSRVKKEEFDRLSSTIQVAPAVEKNVAKKSPKKLNVEMASGDIYKDVTKEKLPELFDTLDDDNFYIILNNGDNYLQAAYSEKGYTVEYQDEKGHFVAHELLSKENTLSLLKKYYQSEGIWSDGVLWDKD